MSLEAGTVSKDPEYPGFPLNTNLVTRQVTVVVVNYSHPGEMSEHGEV